MQIFGRNLVLILVLAAAFGCVRPGACLQREENFDLDPGWDGMNNFTNLPPTLVEQDYGYSPTQFAGGAAPGEIGGQFFRTIEPSYYGKNIIPITMEDSLTCTGRFRVTQSTGAGALLFGWFNHEARGFRPNGWMGIRLDGESGKFRVLVEYGNEINQAGGDRLRDTSDNDLFNVDGTSYDFTFSYDPQANFGQGRMTLKLPPFSQEPFVFDLGSGHKAAGATFDRFGFINQQVPGGMIDVFFDDLTFNGVTEHFDQDPMWEEFGNRETFLDYGQQDNHQFGFTDTNHAGGEPGELGGRIWRTDENHPEKAAYYGDDIGKLTLEDRLFASGKVAMTEGVADSGALFGWFNSSGRGFRPKNFLGVAIEGPSRIGHYFRPIYGTSTEGVGGDSESGPVIRPDATLHDWSIAYDPDASGGNGEITLTFDSETKTLPLKPGHKAVGAEFDRFGLANIEVGGKHVSVFFDDIEYTVEGPIEETTFTATPTSTGALTQTFTFTQTPSPTIDCDFDGDFDCDGIDLIEVIRDQIKMLPETDSDFNNDGGEDGRDLFLFALEWEP